MRKVSIVTSIVILASMLFSSCGGGDDELAKAIENLRSSDLETMVLTASELGSIVNGFVVDSDSGSQDNAAAADDSINPDDDAGDFDDAGRITGYELSFEASNLSAVLASGEGLANVKSEVDLFETADEASADIARKIDELQRYEGRSIDGFTVGTHTEFEVSDLGDETGGLEFSGTIDAFDLTVYATVVYFRIGRLNAAVVVSALDDQNLRHEAEAAARKLEARIRGVALGEINEEAVEIPTEPAVVAPPVDRPDGVPNLAGVALRLSDLPSGFVVEEEAYEAPPDVEFTREFGVDDDLSVSIGRTEVIGVQNTVTLFENPDEASATMGLFGQLLMSDVGRASFAESFAQGSGFEPKLSEFQSFSLDLGNEGVVILGQIETGLGDFAFAFMLVRVDRAVALVSVTALAGQFDLEDIVPLAQLEAQRLVDGPPN